MTDIRPREWVTVAEAAKLAGRKPRTVYEWIDKSLLATRLNEDNVLEVLSKAVIRVAHTRRRGRPRR